MKCPSRSSNLGKLGLYGGHRRFAEFGGSSITAEKFYAAPGPRSTLFRPSDVRCRRGLSAVGTKERSAMSAVRSALRSLADASGHARKTCREDIPAFTKIRSKSAEGQWRRELGGHGSPPKRIMTRQRLRACFGIRWEAALRREGCMTGDKARPIPGSIGELFDASGGLRAT